MGLKLSADMSQGKYGITSEAKAASPGFKQKTPSRLSQRKYTSFPNGVTFRSVLSVVDNKMSSDGSDFESEPKLLTPLAITVTLFNLCASTKLGLEDHL